MWVTSSTQAIWWSNVDILCMFYHVINFFFIHLKGLISIHYLPFLNNSKKKSWQDRQHSKPVLSHLHPFDDIGMVCIVITDENSENSHTMHFWNAALRENKGTQLRVALLPWWFTKQHDTYKQISHTYNQFKINQSDTFFSSGIWNPWQTYPSFTPETVLRYVILPPSLGLINILSAFHLCY